MELTGANSPSLIGGRFGTSVATSDVSGDGKLDFIFGAQTAAAVAGNFTGTAIGAPGDVSGNGIDDLLIGAHGATVNGQAAAGQFYTVYGNRTPFAINNDLATLGGEFVELWTGETAQAAVGFSMANQRGDFNGDGRPDVLVGGLRVDTAATDAGAGYLLLRNGTRYFANGFENSLD